MVKIRNLMFFREEDKQNKTRYACHGISYLCQEIHTGLSLNTQCILFVVNYQISKLTPACEKATYNLLCPLWTKTINIKPHARILYVHSTKTSFGPIMDEENFK